MAGHCPFCHEPGYDGDCLSCGYYEEDDHEQQAQGEEPDLAVPLVPGDGPGEHTGVEGDGRGVLPEVRVAGVSDHSCFRNTCARCVGESAFIGNPARAPMDVPAPDPGVP